MKKRLLSAAVAVCMLLTLLPAGAWAAETEGASLPAGREYSIKLDYPVENSAVSAKFADAAGMSSANGLSGEDTPGLLADGGYATWEDAGNAAVEGEDYTLSYDDSVCTIYTARGLAKIANYVDSMETSFIGWTVRLGNDIDLTTAGVIGYGKDTVTETNSWDPIGGFDYDYSTNMVSVIPFQGVFDGAGHKVQNLYINSSLSSTGLFSCVFTDMTVDGEQVVIKDVVIEGADITGNFMANSFLVGFLSEAIITGCTVDETSVLTIPGDTVQMNGGFVGGAQTAGLNLGGEIYIENCVNNGTISGGMCTGGIAGATGQKLLNCTNNGPVSAGFTNAGGIVGYYKEEGGIAPFEILDCVNNGSVSSVHGWAGGIAGQVDVSSETSLIARCYNTGSVIGSAEVGGIAGGIDNGVMEDCYNTGAVSAHAADSSDLGGIAGYLDLDPTTNGSITNCYNIGTITNGAAASTGGVVGENNGTVTGCFYLEGTAAADFGGSTALSVQQLAEQSTFTDAGWDFETTWGMSGLLGRPVLQTVPEAQGSGAQDDPIEIPDLETLERFRDKVNGGNSYEGIYIKLAADIDLLGDEENQWTPIGSSGDPFKGTFDGGDFAISGLYINDSTAQYQGLFGYLGENGRIENLSVSGKITAKQYAGGIVGYNLGGSLINCENNAVISGETGIGGIVGVNAPNANIAATIESCRNNGDISAVDGSEGGYIGGIAGTNSGDRAVITDCQNYGDVFSNAEWAMIGGIAGCNYHRIENCTNEGTVSAMNNASCVGGIAGSNGGEIYGCASKATVTGGGSEILTCAGGIVGNNAQSGDHILAIENCYNEGAVTAAGNMAGGIAGYQTAGMIKNCYNTGGIDSENYISGGVVGYYTAGDIQNCYNTGALTGSYVADGVVGYYLEDSTEPAVENCYYNSDELTGGDTGAGVTGKTAAQFASGEVAYLLQGGQPAGGDGTIPQVWGQALSGDEPDVSPVLTADDDKTVYKVAFMVDGAEYAAAYANPNGTVALPQAPDSEVYDFVKWSQTADAEGTEFTAQTPVTGDMAVYAIGQEMFGGTEDEKTIITTYGMGATQDLTAYMTYAGETDATGKFTYTITGGNKDTATANGNTVSASIADDTLTIPADTHADTYTLTITATEKTPVIVPFSVEYGTEPVTFDVTILVSPAAPVPAEGVEITAERVRRGNSLSASEITGTVNGLDGQPLEGVWTWKNDREMDETGTFEETAVFTPTDTNYAPFETTVSVTVYRPSSGGGSLTTRYTVTFDTQGGSEIDSIRVTRNGTVTKPEKPTKDGYIFEGWFTDKDCTQAYDFSTRVTKNITLYAKWTEEQPEDPDNPTDPDEPDNPDEPTPPAEWENPYSDVAESDWFYDAVKYADENGLFAGTAETTFAPEESLTRAMLVTVLWRAEGQPVVNYLMTFADVDAGAYYGEAVRWAASEGIVKGYSEVEFAPDDLITREQIAAIMQRYADFKGIAADETADLARFTDAAQVSDWAVGNMQWAVGTGLISGRDDGSLAPQDNTTRAEAAAILMRFLEK